MSYGSSRYLIGVRDAPRVVLEQLLLDYGRDDVLVHPMTDKAGRLNRSNGIESPTEKHDFLRSIQHLVLGLSSIDELDVFVSALRYLLRSRLRSIYLITSRNIEPILSMGTESEQRGVRRL